MSMSMSISISIYIVRTICLSLCPNGGLLTGICLLLARVEDKEALLLLHIYIYLSIDLSIYICISFELNLFIPIFIYISSPVFACCWREWKTRNRCCCSKLAAPKSAELKKGKRRRISQVKDFGLK